MTTLVKSIATLAQVVAAGFNVTGVKSIMTHDGYCWNATLCSGKSKLVTVSNGGFGGPDEFSYIKLNRDSVFTALGPLFALPLVQEFFKDQSIQMEQWTLEAKRCTPEEFETKKQSILNEVVKVDEDMLGTLVDHLRASKEEVASIKRKLKGKTAWFEKGKEDGNSFVHISIPDTPENRKSLEAKYPEISIYLNDLINDL